VILTLSKQERELVWASIKFELSLTVSFLFGGLGLILVNSQCKHANCKSVQRVIQLACPRFGAIKTNLTAWGRRLSTGSFVRDRSCSAQGKNGKGKWTSSFKTFLKRKIDVYLYTRFGLRILHINVREKTYLLSFIIAPYKFRAVPLQ